LAATVPFDARGSGPLEWSPFAISNPTVTATCLKRAEDDGDLVLRMYESQGEASQGMINANLPLASASWVNFIEDKLGNAQVSARSIPLNLHGYEIRTVKIKLAGNKGVDLLSAKAK
jgi:alpha-mannosidase